MSETPPTVVTDVPPLRFALPKGVADAILNRGQVAAALNISEPTVDKWVAAGMPVLESGANGRAYKFQLSACWNWKCERDETRRRDDEDAERAVQQMRLALIGGSSGDGERSLSPKERRDLYEAEAAWMKAAALRRELIPVGEVVDLIEDIFAVVRDGINALPDRLAREIGLDGRQAEKVIAAGDDTLSEARRRIADRHLRAA